MRRDAVTTTATGVTDQPEAGASRADIAGAARSGALGLFGAGVAAVGGFALTIVVTRGLGSEGAGVFFEAFAVFTILAAVGAAGADTGLLYIATRSRAIGRVSELRRAMAIAFGPTTLVAIGIAVAVYFAAPWMSEMLVDEAHQDEGAEQFAVLAPFLVIAILGLIGVQATRGFGGLRTYVALQQLLLPLGRVAAVALVLAFGMHGLAVPLAWAFPLLIVCPLGLFALYRQLRRTERNLLSKSQPPRPVGEIAREFWAYASGRGFAQAFTQSITWADVIIVGALRSAHEAGIYAALSRFVTTGTLVMQAMRLGIQPQLGAALAVGEKRRAEDLYRITTQWIIATSWPLYLVLATFGPQVLRLFGDDFTAGADALAILSVSMLFSLATGNVNTVLLMAGKSRWNAANTVVALSVNIGLNLTLVPGHGIIGAAIAWSASIFCERLMGMYEVRVFLGMRGFGKGAAVAIALSALLYGGVGLAVRLTVGATFPAFVAYLVGTTAVYGAALWLVRDTLGLSALMAILRKRAGGGPPQARPGAPRGGGAGPRPSRPRWRPGPKGRHRKPKRWSMPGRTHGS
jgi:O-antigen/teichoic acid export membrane protein